MIRRSQSKSVPGVRRGGGGVGEGLPALPLEPLQGDAPQEPEGIFVALSLACIQGLGRDEPEHDLPVSRDRSQAREIHGIAEPRRTAGNASCAPGEEAEAEGLPGHGREAEACKHQGRGRPGQDVAVGWRLRMALAQGGGGLPGVVEEHEAGAGGPGQGPEQEIHLEGGDGGHQEEEEAHEQELAALGRLSG